MNEKGARRMGSSISNHARQYRDESRDMGYPEKKFGRSPWEKIEYHDLNKATVTLWIGVASVIVAISIPDIDPDDLFEVSVHGTRLSFRGTALSNYFSQDLDLPCAVEANPIYITEGKGILSVLLVKKEEAETEISEYAARGQGLSRAESIGP
jgi:HSP20 family molecular chaperone IbpA